MFGCWLVPVGLFVSLRPRNRVYSAPYMRANLLNPEVVVCMGTAGRHSLDSPCSGWSTIWLGYVGGIHVLCGLSRGRLRRGKRGICCCGEWYVQICFGCSISAVHYPGISVQYWYTLDRKYLCLHQRGDDSCALYYLLERSRTEKKEPLSHEQQLDWSTIDF